MLGLFATKTRRPWLAFASVLILLAGGLAVFIG